MSGLGGLNKSPNGVVMGLVQLQLPVVDTPAQLAAQTQRIDIGSAVFQIPRRTPANTAMTAATALADPRFDLATPLKGPFRALPLPDPAVAAAARASSPDPRRSRS